MFIIGCSSCLCFRCTNMAWRRIASHSGMSGRSCIGKTGRWQGFKISSKLEWPGSLFRAGGAPVPGGGRVLHWLPSHSQKVPQLQRNSLWRTFQFLSTSYIDINNMLWFIFGTPDLQIGVNIFVCYCCPNMDPGNTWQWWHNLNSAYHRCHNPLTFRWIVCCFGFLVAWYSTAATVVCRIEIVPSLPCVAWIHVWIHAWIHAWVHAHIYAWVHVCSLGQSQKPPYCSIIPLIALYIETRRDPQQ